MPLDTITKGNRAVVINWNEHNGRFWANLYVNARDGIENADTTTLRWEGKTRKGAVAWAMRQLDETR